MITRFDLDGTYAAVQPGRKCSNSCYQLSSKTISQCCINMFNISATREEVADAIVSMDGDDFSRFLYCQRMTSTFMAVHLFEHSVTQAMLMCDRVKVGKALGSDTKAWQLISRRDELQASTLGSLIRILDKHGFDPSDIRYLKWVKDKRDHFVHRLFHDGSWPGDLNAAECRHMARRLISIELWLSRASRRIWHIFRKAGLIEIDSLGVDGI